MAKQIVMSEEEFRKEYDNVCNLGFKHGVDLVLKMSKLVMPSDLYSLMEASAQQAEPYIAGKKVEEEDIAWKRGG